MDPIYFTVGGVLVSTVMSIAAFLATRGDKNDARFSEVAKNTNEIGKQLAEFGVQMANLRTDLAQQELARMREMDGRYVTRREFQNLSELVRFNNKLTLETHKRFHPDAVLHEPLGFRD